ncbi:transcriptional regulator [Nocardia huaxiensis]|uniref:Transcriptional regulator n=1 Tax=Nocardia huaxiensis TaxID=2755382 RepID=A0A7D6VI89_9NOCA|nr:transcriptional regulator [Nocardia huaxiensis]QLY30636.1 transcriptional regulator [Nocardia huaxiensis]UFS95755.1 transcriptional regulator [Nocardia huaxiensis]
MESVSAPQRRPALILFVVVASGACLALGYWQWTRFESTGGTAQNLGYALQWPLFAGFVVWAYFRFVRLENNAEQEANPQVAEESTPRPKRPKAAAPKEIPAGILPERPKAATNDDPELAEYNKYLAGLHAHDMDQQIRDHGLGTNTEGNAG